MRQKPVGIFNNREIATAIWIVLIFGWALFQPNVRTAFLGVIQAFFQPKILVFVGLMIIYVTAAVAGLYAVHFWNVALLKDTVLWFQSNWRRRYNFDGLIAEEPSADDGKVTTYLQAFRNGSLEAVETRLLHDDAGQDRLIIPKLAEREIIQALSRLILIEQRLGVTPCICNA